MADSTDEVIPAGWEKRLSRSTGEFIIYKIIAQFVVVVIAISSILVRCAYND